MPSPDKKPAVIYARYSSHTQRDVSIEQQVDACRRYAEQNHLEVLRVYADRAMTGTNDNRPSFRQMLRDSESRAFGAIIVYSLDRFSRDRYDSAVHKHTLKENGVRVLSAMEQIQDNPTGILIESILEGFAEYYSRELAQKIRRGMSSNVQKCMVIGPCPFGYRRGADGRFEIVPEEATIVRYIFEQVAAGKAFVRIFDALNEKGILTRAGKPWSRSSFDKLLSNEKYIGVYNCGGAHIEDGIPAIIDRDLFLRVQDRVRTKPNPRLPQKRRRDGGTYLLTGKLFCGHCGAPMLGVSGTGRNGLHYYYACKTRRETKDCDKRPVLRDAVETQIAHLLHTLMAREDVVEWLVRETLDYLKSNKDTSEITLLENRLAEIRRQKANTLHAVRLAPAIKSLLEMLHQLEDDEADVEAKLASAKAALPVLPSAEELTAFVHILTEGSVTDKRYQETLFNAFLVRATVYDDHLKLYLNFTTQGSSEITLPLTDPPPDSYKLVEAPPLPPYTNHAFKVFILRGLVVLVAQIPGVRSQMNV